MPSTPLLALTSPDWTDYTLLDSGNGLKLEQFGPYRLVRPDDQAKWRPALPKSEWAGAHAQFKLNPPQDGQWEFRQALPEKWVMHYRELQFYARPTPFRHMGVFPEQAVHWDWMTRLIKNADRPIRVLNLFGYTGIASLFAAQAGAQVTHVDASKPTVAWGRENQTLAGLADKPIRWIVEDAIKYVEREVKRDSHYEGILLDPPPFGHGPKGEIWKFADSLPRLLAGCQQLWGGQPLFMILTAYTTQAELPDLQRAVGKTVAGWGGTIEAGTAELIEKSAGRILQPATFVRWEKERDSIQR
ncbi:MAG: class I SAM-dependent methyltransferase [Chloroflexi bacterium]|nr:class I SAM-dependent methyltransferase [Chloroflexota bacterium]